MAERRGRKPVTIVVGGYIPREGHFLEGSWDNAYYTRQWSTLLDVEVIVMPSTTNHPGGAGEFAASEM
jgi:isoquinoline 1-oxidoreductase beta subunit